MEKFYVTKPYLQENAFMADSYFEEADIRKIAKTAVRWILDNEKKYIIQTASAEDLFKKLEYLPDTAEIYEYTGLLDLFCKEFLNNPYVYENKVGKMQSRDKIYSKEIACYFVSYKAVGVPLGAIKELAGDEVYRAVVTDFIKDRIEHYKNNLNADIELCGQYREATGARLKEKYNAYTIKIILFAVLLILAGQFIFRRLVFGVEWENYSDIVDRSSGFFQAMGFLTEKSYGMDHNCWLNHIYLILSVIWAIIFLFCVKSVLKLFRNRAIFSHKRAYCLKCNHVEKKLRKILSKMEKDAEALENLPADQFDFISTEQKKHSKLFGCISSLESPFFEKVTVQRASTYRQVMRETRVFSVIFLIILAAMTIRLSGLSDDTEFINKINSYTQQIRDYADKRDTYIKKEFRVKDRVTVRTMPSYSSHALYELTPEHIFYFTYGEDSLGKVEGWTNLRFYTEYGYLSGWVEEFEFEPYSPEGDAAVVQIAPSGAEASIDEYETVANVYDGKKSTSWKLNGKSSAKDQYIDLILPEASPVEMLMLQTGNRYFGANSRPTGFSVVFMLEDNIEKTFEIKLEDSSDKQYFRINKGIKADRIRFIITNTARGKLSNNLYVAELAAYEKAAETN